MPADCDAARAPPLNPALPLRLPTAELQLPPGSRARFVLKRRNRLCVTEAVQADAAGTVEWNTRCTQVRAAATRAAASPCCQLGHQGRSVPPRLPSQASSLPGRRLPQTATLVKDGASWRPKQFIFKVQLVRGEAA